MIKIDKRRFWQYAALAAVIAALTVFLLLPIYAVVSEGLRPKLLIEVLSNYIYREGLFNSAAVAAVTTLLVFAVAMPLALLYDRWNFPLKRYSPLLVMLPMILPPFVGALGFQQLLGHYGVFNTLLIRCGLPRVDFLGGGGIFWAVCVIEALHLYPILYLNLVAALGNIDPSLDEAARNLGASRSRRFFTITLPMLKSGILAGGSIVFIWSFTELGTPLMFGYERVTPVQIFNALSELETNPVPYALVVIMLFSSALFYLTGRAALSSGAASGGKGQSGSAAQALSGWRKYGASMLFLTLTLVAVLPHIALVLTAFSLRWYDTVLPGSFSLINFENALSDKLVLPSVFNSLRYSLAAMVFAVAAGTVVSLAQVRWRLRFGRLADMLAMLPLAVPGIVVAFGYLAMAVKFNWTGGFFNPVEDPLFLLAAAYAVRRLPYVVRSVSAGLEQLPEDYEQAARSFGASPVRAFARITLPLIAANLAAGVLLAFCFSMLEVSDSLILAQKAEYFPITRAIYELSHILGSGPYIACAFGVWAMLFLAVALAATGALLGRKLGSVFRL